MNEYIVYGMRRSGLHCICFDILKTHKLNHIESDVDFINDTDYNNYKTSIKTNKMFLFEDKFYKNELIFETKTVIIIRDIYDVIISRTKKNTLWSKIDNSFINTYIDLLNEILDHTNYYPNKIVINYNKYIEANSEYRKDILNNKFNFKIIDGMYEEIPEYGGGKTFKENESRNDVKVSMYVFSLIVRNKIFLSLIKEYFGYNLIDKLRKHLPVNINLKYR